jgi:hypothetical protein
MARTFWGQIPKSWLVLGVAAVAVLLYLAASWYWIPLGSSVSAPGTGPTPTGKNVTVTSVDFIPDYTTTNPADAHYLTTSYCYDSLHPGCGSGSGYLLLPPCPSSGCANITPGSSFTYSLTLVNNDTVDHQIINITLGEPMVLLGLTPSVPCSLAPETPTTFEITIATPETPGEYGLTGTVNTS